MSLAIRQSTARTIYIPMPFVDLVDGVTPKTALTLGDITAAVVKRGAASDTVSRSTITLTASGGSNDFVHVGDGYWKLELTASQTDTVGQLAVTFRDDDVFLPVVVNCWVYDAQVFDSLGAGSDTLEVDVTAFEGSALSSADITLNSLTLSRTTPGAALTISSTDSAGNAVSIVGGNSCIVGSATNSNAVSFTSSAGIGMLISGAGTPGHAVRLVANGASGVGINIATAGGASSDGTFDGNVVQISGDATAADNLESYCDGTVNQPVDVQEIDDSADAALQLKNLMGASPYYDVDDSGFTPTTTQFEANTSEATDDHFNGRRVVFITGLLKFQETTITDYDGTNKRFTVDAMTEAPSDGDRFVIR